MNSHIRRESALILQFPPPDARARLARIGQTNAKQSPSRLDITTFGSGGAWYHEAAIVEADRPRKP